jgi:hypothetical protein
MKRFLLLLLLVWPAGVTARVLSYAPYTDQVAVRAHQPRTTRWFALTETTPAAAYDGLMYGGKVVLYDSTGAEPPREVFPQPGIYSGAIRQVGLYERPGSPEPVLVVVEGIPNASTTWISSNGGRSWRRIAELENLRPRPTKEPDRGGPWSHGLGAPLRIGNNAYPFVISFVEGVYAISETRPPKLLFAGQTTDNTLLGQNRAGTQFLIQTHRNTLIVTDHNARWRSIGNVVANFVSGWIADDGSIYVIAADEKKRSVYRYVNRRAELVASSDLETSFAVPAADFSGFWFVEHEPKTTTNLKRWTPANGLETLWEDADAPEVEALHADDSGDALLIQVHRERAKQDLSFLDPALAVWRIGEPAPAVYDELFLIEGPRKGFVHLDVEAVAAGAPFVFDSGYVRPAPPDVVISPPMDPPPTGGGGGGVIQEWGVVRASLEQRLVIQGVTRTTDLVISNPVHGKQSVRIELGDRATTIELESQEIRVIAVSSLFELGDGTATLHFLPQYGIAALAHVRTAGGAGYAVQAVDSLNASSPRFPVTFSGAMPGADFRSNLILTDTSGHGIDARVQACTTSGLAGDARVALDGSEEIEGANAVIVRPRRGSLIAGVVAVDERSGDATYFTPDIPAPSARTIPFVANTETLVSELYLLNLSSTTRSVMLEVKPYDSSQWPRQQTYRLLPYETRVIANPLKTLFGMSGIARLRYASWGQPGDTTGVRVTSRAYTVAANGGTYGSAIPPLNSFQSVTADEALEILGIRSGFTASLGLVELSPNPRNQPARVRVTIADERGNRLDTFETTVQPAGGVLIDDLFASRNIPQPAAARVTVEALDAWALVGAYAVITDQSTKDPTYLGANLAAKPK